MKFNKIITSFIFICLVVESFAQQQKSNLSFDFDTKIVQSYDLSKTINFNNSCINFSEININDLQIGDVNSVLETLEFFTNNQENAQDCIPVVIEYDENLINYSTSDEVYSIQVATEEITIKAVALPGVIRALIYFDNLMLKTERNLFEFHVLDYPLINKRYIHLTQIGKKGIIKVNELIDLAAKNKFNGVILKITRDVRFETFGDSKLRDSFITKESLIEIINYCRTKGFEVILEFKLLTHQDRFYFNKEYLINKETYDTQNPEVYTQLLSLFKEVKYDLNVDGVHIGHDELYGYRSYHKKLDNILSEEHFLEDIIKLRSLILDLDLTLFMWGDMFLSTDRFSRMYNKSLHGNAKLEQLLDSLPKDIVINTFHYWDVDFYDSLPFIDSKGFQTSGGTWCFSKNIINQTNYMLTNFSFDKRMMVATTWCGAINHRRAKIIQKGCDLLEIEDIINFTGKTFW
jgi:hypothetical protein